MNAETCPHCQAVLQTKMDECPYCGIILAKYRPRTTPRPAEQSLRFQAESDGPEPISRSLWIQLGIGTGLGLLFTQSAMLSFILQYLFILVHEIGHALTAWALAIPAVPAFDFSFGGGATLTFDKNWSLRFLIYLLGFGTAGWAFSKGGKPIGLLVLIGLYALVDFTSLSSVMVTTMGHGFEWIIMILFVYRGLSGRSVIHQVERPLYVLLATWGAVNRCSMGWGLWSSAYLRETYSAAKGGHMEMDLDILAQVIGTSTQSLGLLFALISLATLPIGYLCYRYEPQVQRGLQTVMAHMLRIPVR
ncbi:MAG: hypothetical protein H6510_02315 [Acidobacteria bacterium]|nr:hypothetical protein [Acidobacteriota bacterium]MCB9396628.1 hypothetical protein [Acidobacteriota bacterium]